MNDSEVTMHDTRHPGDLIVYRIAIEAAAIAIALVKRVPAPSMQGVQQRRSRCSTRYAP